MNMIPLVMANEPGKAQLVNHIVNCSLKKPNQYGIRCKSFWNEASERVRIPSDIGSPCVRLVFAESRTLELVR